MSRRPVGLASVQHHGGCTALVTDKAGTGKTAWLQEFARRQSGARVLRGVCDALSTSRSLAPLHDIARQTQGRLPAALDSAARPGLKFGPRVCPPPPRGGR